MAGAYRHVLWSDHESHVRPVLLIENYYLEQCSVAAAEAKAAARLERKELKTNGIGQAMERFRSARRLRAGAAAAKAKAAEFARPNQVHSFAVHVCAFRTSIECVGQPSESQSATSGSQPFASL